MKRRTFVLSTVLSPFILSACNDWSGTSVTHGKNNNPPIPADPYWDDDAVQKIIKDIRLPAFPAQDFSITAYGALSGGTDDCLSAFTAAIQACHDAGGGCVVVPSGTWLVNGPITLLSNVNLYLESADTIVLFGTDPAFYPTVLTQFEANPCYNYSPFLYAYQANNIAVTGLGTFDGQASTTAWWPWKGSATYGNDPSSANPIIAGNQAAESDALKNSADEQSYLPWSERVLGYTPAFGPNASTGKMSFLRPNFVGFWGCEVVLIEGVTFTRSPMWIVAPVLCTDVTVRGVTVESLGTNNDGCDPVCCSGVLIDGCTFNTGDDCIAIKSGRGGDGFNFSPDGTGGPRPSYNIVIQNCKMAEGHGGVTLGSEISGGVYNVYAQNITMSSTNLYAALRLKSNSGIGGYIRNIYMRNINVPAGTSTANNLYGALLLDGNYNGYASPQQNTGGTRNYEMRDIFVSDFQCGPSNAPIFINIYAPDLAAASSAPGENCIIKDINVRHSSFGPTARDPAGVAAVVYNLGVQSGKAGTPQLSAPEPELAGLQAPTLVDVTVNGSDQSTATA